MYYLLAASLMFTIVYSDRLENTYLPPNRAQSAGGNGAFLKTPIRTAPPSQLYGAASGSFSGSAAGNINVAAKGNFGPTSPPIAILRLNNENNGDGKYAFDFETENHITQQESGQLKNEDNFAAQGSYSFQAPDGNVYSINYIADENGFQAQGEHIPTAPPVPAEILKALEQNAADEAAGIVDDGQYRPDPSEGYQGNKYLAPKTGPAPSPNNGGYRY